MSAAGYRTGYGSAVRLSPVELLGCWQALELGDTPGPLWIRPPGTTDEDRERLLAGTVAGLAARGLSDGSRPHPTLAGMLRVIADAPVLVDVRFTDGAGAPMLGIGALAGAYGVTLVTRDGVEGLSAPIELTALDATRVTGTLLGLAGPVRAGVGAAVNVPADALDAALASAARAAGSSAGRAAGAAAAGSGHGAATDLWALGDRLVELGVPGREASSLARMCSGVTASGQLGATGRSGPWRAERRGGWVVGFHRTARGWFGQLRRGGMVSVYPADPQRLLRAWHELIESVRPAA
jgi:hypothetical protein